MDEAIDRAAKVLYEMTLSDLAARWDSPECTPAIKDVWRKRVVAVLIAAKVPRTMGAPGRG
jgi:hypothetical protein